LVEDLLFLARAEVGAVRFEMQSIALEDVLDVALMEARVLAEANAQVLHTELPDRPIRVEGDPERLTQALLIVLDNAVKYSDAGQPIEVELRREGHEARVRVVNGGPGIPKADMPYVFNRFYRGRQDVGHQSDGSGLGLSIAKWIVDTHGGRMEIESEQGETAVVMFLPLAA
jgi:signal transduction histidine kinase